MRTDTIARCRSLVGTAPHAVLSFAAARSRGTAPHAAFIARWRSLVGSRPTRGFYYHHLNQHSPTRRVAQPIFKPRTSYRLPSKSSPFLLPYTPRGARGGPGPAGKILDRSRRTAPMGGILPPKPPGTPPPQAGGGGGGGRPKTPPPPPTPKKTYTESKTKSGPFWRPTPPPASGPKGPRPLRLRRPPAVPCRRGFFALCRRVRNYTPPPTGQAAFQYPPYTAVRARPRGRTLAELRPKSYFGRACYGGRVRRSGLS